MVESRCRLCFALEPPQSSRIRSHALGQELQRDAAVQLEVFSLVDHTHPATANLAQEAVVRDGLADHGAEAYFHPRCKSMKGRSPLLLPSPVRTSARRSPARR